MDESAAVPPPLVTVRFADFVALPTMALIATTVSLVTVEVVTVKFAEV